MMDDFDGDLRCYQNEKNQLEDVFLGSSAALSRQLTSISNK